MVAVPGNTNPRQLGHQQAYSPTGSLHISFDLEPCLGDVANTFRITAAASSPARAVAACSLAFHSVALDSLPYGNPTGSINLRASSFNRQRSQHRLALTEHRKRQPRSPTLLRSACWRQSEMFGEFRK